MARLYNDPLAGVDRVAPGFGAGEHEPVPTPGPDREQLLALLS